MKIPSGINLFRTLLTRFNYVDNRSRVRNIFCFQVHKKVTVEMENTSSVEISEGPFVLGKHWSDKAVFPSLFKMSRNARLIVHGRFTVYDASTVFVNENAVLELGSGYINSKANISCFEKIRIGNDVVISEGVSIRDSDNHTFAGSGESKTKPIEIGDHVWIGMNVTILKGVTIGSGSVIAAGALVNKDVLPNSLVGGVPARVIKSSVEWIR